MASAIALFGGTFDPIHNAHLEVARAAADRFAIAQVMFIPAANPPHKAAGPVAAYEDRVRMAELACAGDSRFAVSRIEEGSARSYSILTVEKLRRETASPLWFLIGADAFAEIQTWFRWRDLVAAVEFVVVARPGAKYQTPEGATVHELDGLSLPISSSEIRARIAAGCWDVPAPEAVVSYIRGRGLYAPPVTKTQNNLNPCGT